MFQFSLKTLCSVLTIVILLLSCGEDEDIEIPEEDEKQITQVLRERWKKGYDSRHWGPSKSEQEERVRTYMSAFWPDDFSHEFPNSSINFKIDSIDDEKECVRDVFQKFDKIKLEISEPPDIEPISEQIAEVTNEYYIQFRTSDGYAYYAEGKNIFTFEKKDDGWSEEENNLWRISKWVDEATSPKEIIDSIM